jgi:hypothetical protein
MNERTGEDALGLGLWFLFRFRFGGGLGLFLRFRSGLRLLFAFCLSNGLGFGNSLAPFPLLEAVALEEALHAASRVHDAVLAGEEGMTPAAHLDVQMRLGGAGLKGVATGADDGRLYVFWMNIRLHGRPQLLLGA